MKVTPLDLKKADFKRVLRGFDPHDVGDLLAAAAETLEEMVRENRNLKEKQNQLGERLKSYKSMEKTLNDTLISAQRSGDATRQAAEREAELIVAKAEVQAEKLVEGAKSELKKIRYQIEMLEHEKDAFLVKMRSLVASQWKILQEDFEPHRTMFSGPEQEKPSPPLSEDAAARIQTPAPAAAQDYQPDNGQPADEEPEFPGVGDLSGQLGKILGSDGENSRPEEVAPVAEREEGDGFSLGADNSGFDEAGGGQGDTARNSDGDKPEVFWGDEPAEDRENK